MSISAAAFTTQTRSVAATATRWDAPDALRGLTIIFGILVIFAVLIFCDRCHRILKP